MEKLLEIRQVNKPLYSQITKSDLGVFITMLIFIFLNTLKITLFNYFMIPEQNLATFSYKFVITLLLTVIIFPVIFKFKTFIPFVLVYILEIAYIVANMSYYLFYHSYVHIMQWTTLFKEAFLSAGHSAAPMNMKMLIILVDIPVFVYVLFNYSKVANFNSKIRFQRLILSLFAFSLIVAIEISNYSNGMSVVQYSKEGFSGETPIVERYGTVANNIVSLYRNGGEKGHEKNLVYGKEQTNTKVSNSKPNFVIIQVESMDANIVNKKYKNQYVTPFLHDLAGKSIYYPYTMSYHMGGGTSDCEFSIINSVQPLTDYPAIKLTSYDYPNSLMKKLSASAYKTLAFHGNIASFYNRDQALPKMGFNNFYDIAKMNMKDLGWGAPDNDVFNYTFNTIKNTKQPFISYDITMTSHEPFTSASTYYNNELFNDITDNNVKNYFNSMSYVDKSIESFVKQIQANFKNTYIFIWGDHTPNVESDIYYKQATFTMDNKYFEFVPLIIVTPDKKVYTEKTQVASFVDISPTILYASGTKFSVRSNGEDLINDPEADNPVAFKGSDYDRKLLFNKITGN